MFFISAGDTQAPVFDAELLKDAVRARWPDASWDEIPEGNYSHEWSIPRARRAVECRLDRERKTIVVDAEIDDAVDVALWIGTLVPERKELYFFDEQNTALVPLTPDTRADEVLSAFDGSAAG